MSKLHWLCRTCRPCRNSPCSSFPTRLKNLLAITLAAFALTAAAASDAAGKRLVVGDPPPHTTGAFRPFVIPGEIAESDGLVELRQGRSITVWCPERVARERSAVLAAAQRFVDSPFLPVGSVSVAYVGDAGGARVLESLGVKFTSHEAKALPDPSQTQLIVVGPGAGRGLQTPEEKKAFRDRLASRMVVVLPGADLSLLPYGLSRERTTIRAKDAASVPDIPAFAGIRRDFGDFLRLADGTACDVVTGGPAWTLAAAPACVAHVKNRNQSAVILTVAPGDVPAQARAALTRVWCTILANLNVETPFRP